MCQVVTPTLETSPNIFSKLTIIFLASMVVYAMHVLKELLNKNQDGRTLDRYPSMGSSPMTILQGNGGTSDLHVLVQTPQQ